MHYPDKLVEIQNGFSLYAPDPEMIKSVYENLRTEDHTTLFPFWAQIWPSAKAMATFLQSETQLIQDKQVLEIGAGIGLPSFMMAQYASSVIISDHSEDAVVLMEKNIRHLNLKHVRAMCLDWNHFPDSIYAELLLLSDINYAPDQFPSLLKLIRKFLEKGATIILSTPQRITVSPFAEAIKPFIKRSVLETVEHLNQMVDVRIVILSK